MDNYELVARILASQALQKTLSPQAKSMFRHMSQKGNYSYNQGELTQYYTVPVNADHDAFQEVCQYIDVIADPGARIILKDEGGNRAREMPRESRVVSQVFSKLDPAVIAGVLRDHEMEAGPLPTEVRNLLFPIHHNPARSIALKKTHQDGSMAFYKGEIASKGNGRINHASIIQVFRKAALKVANSEIIPTTVGLAGMPKGVVGFEFVVTADISETQSRKILDEVKQYTGARIKIFAVSK